MQLTIKTDDKKTVTVPALMVEGKEDRAGVVTSVVNGVTYLVELHTTECQIRLRKRHRSVEMSSVGAQHTAE